METKEKILLEKTYAFLKKVWGSIRKMGVADFLLWVFIIVVNVFYIHTILKNENKPSQDVASTETIDALDDSCNVLTVDVAGSITSNGINGSGEPFSSDGDRVYSDEVKAQLDTARTKDNIKAVLLLVNSLGGDAGSAQEIVYALKHLNKPVVSVIRSAGTSGGYWIASAASRVFAYETADVGSIGVTLSHLDETMANTKDGKVFVSLSSGKFKDTGNPDKSLTEEEKALLMRDINGVYNIFIKEIAENRKLSIEKVKALADGSSMLAGQAKESGLIDEVGSTYDAIDYLSKILGEKAETCKIGDKE